MARPAFLPCDTDAVIQFLLTKQVKPLQVLRNRYGIQPIVVPEVDIELRSNRRFARRISPDLNKAIAHNLLCVLDRRVLEQHYGGGSAGAMAATAALSSIASTGLIYSGPADFGEAYTHAAAITLQVPALSHDRRALDALIGAGLPVPSTVLRAFDLLALAYQVSQLSANECDQFRASLVGENEYIPACFKNRSFVDGLPNFCPRLVDGTAPRVGSTSCPQTAFSTEILL